MKAYIITGTSKGLGKAITLELDKEGNQIISIGRSNPPVVKKAKIKHYQVDFNQVIPFEIDLDLSKIKELTLIINAGTLNPIGKFTDVNLTEWLKGFNVNFLSQVSFVQSVFKRFQDVPITKKALFISTGAALNPYAGWSLYCSSKAALRLFSLSLSEEQESEVHPFSITNLHPGVIDTNMQDLIRKQTNEAFPMKKKFEQLQSEKKLQNPHDVAKKILKLLNQQKLPKEISINEI